jgi:hypothetical protein
MTHSLTLDDWDSDGLPKKVDCNCERGADHHQLDDQQPDRKVIQCNYRKATKVAVEGARAYLMLNNRGNANDRIMILVRSRGGRWVGKWEAMANLHNFRVKTLSPGHPLYDDQYRIWQERNPARQSLLDEMVAELNAASTREAR